MTARWRSGSPIRTPRFADRGRVQGFGTATVAGTDVGPEQDQLPSDVDVVGECRSVQRGVALIHLGVTLRDEELLAAQHPSGSQPRRRREGCTRVHVVARCDVEKQPEELLVVAHAAG